MLRGVPWIHILSGLQLRLALILLGGGLELEQHIHHVGQKPKAVSSCQSPPVSLPPLWPMGQTGILASGMMDFNSAKGLTDHLSVTSLCI